MTAVMPRAPRLATIRWPDSTVVVLASGESLTERQCEQVRVWRAAGGGRRVIVINTTFRRAPWADVLYACDAMWWRVNFREVVKTFHVEQCYCTELAATRDFQVRFIESRNEAGLGMQPGVIHQGGNSGYQAVNIAFQAGAKKVVLLGFDLHGGHWHGKHPLPLSNAPEALWMKRVIEFKQLALDLHREGIDVINATPDSALPWFAMMDLEKALS